MANSNLLKEAIADAKAVRETAIANAKIALEEAFTPRLQNMLSQKIQNEIEDEDDKKDEVKDEDDMEERDMMDDDEDMEERAMNDEDEDPSDKHSEEMDESEIIEIDGKEHQTFLNINTKADLEEAIKIL